jgi:hypothetical protein
MNWIFGFTVGVLTVMGYDRIQETKELPAELTASASEIITAYNQGRDDALKTNPVSWDLDRACLEIWANKQGIEDGSPQQR